MYVEADAVEVGEDGCADHGRWRTMEVGTVEVV